MSATVEAPAFQPADYKTDLKPVWCAGCGDFGVLTGLYRAMAEMQLTPWETVVISGIGCSSRLPGYVDTYGFNSVHGRALPIATGVKAARPELSVVAVGGDGDGLAIGGNHFMHASRRNLDITYILMDNEIYGLTKGQAAPTTPTGDKTKSTFYGNPERSVDPCELAISMGATWVARGFSGDMKGLVDLMVRGMKHSGFSFINVISPCVTWRGDDQFKSLKAKMRGLPEGYDPSSRSEATKYTREADVMTVGLLYHIHHPSLTARLQAVREKAHPAGSSELTTADVINTYIPDF